MTTTMPKPSPRVLLVEDDPASRAFLAAAMAAMPAVVVEAAGCRAALALADREPRFDLWLVDAQLGDGDGASLLACLRERDADTPALAHTASLDAKTLEGLRASGFDAVVTKPLPAVTLREAARALLGEAAGDWNDAAAMAALNGNPAHVSGLRKLFLDELPGQMETVSRALEEGRLQDAAAVLHRLRASCGFVGASRLGDAVQVLEAQPQDAGALARVKDAVAALA